MLRYAAQSVRPVAAFAARKSLWASFFAFIIWSGIEAYDGASDRFQARYSQAKDTVVPPVESTFEKVTSIASNLWASIEANPGPSLLALGIFAFTIIYHKMSGKSLKEAFATTLIHAAPAKPTIIQKAEQELLQERLLNKETELEQLISNLPQQINNAKTTADVLYKEADRAREQAEVKKRRADKAAEEHANLVKKLEVAKADIVALKEQLAKA